MLLMILCTNGLLATFEICSRAALSCRRRPGQTKWPTASAMKLSSTLLVSGMKKSRPANRNRKSPGNFPSPSFSSHGRSPLKMTSASRMTINQRITG